MRKVYIFFEPSRAVTLVIRIIELRYFLQCRIWIKNWAIKIWDLKGAIDLQLSRFLPLRKGTDVASVLNVISDEYINLRTLLYRSKLSSGIMRIRRFPFDTSCGSPSENRDSNTRRYSRSLEGHTRTIIFRIYWKDVTWSEQRFCFPTTRLIKDEFNIPSFKGSEIRKFWLFFSLESLFVKINSELGNIFIP